MLVGFRHPYGVRFPSILGCPALNAPGYFQASSGR